jgi:hypothetical protein
MGGAHNPPSARGLQSRIGMSSNDIHGIEHGWKVRSADGSDVGTVVETTDTYIEVKSGLLNATHRYLPAASLAHVRPELGEIGVSLTHAEIEEGDWSDPPMTPPRTEGAPLNVGDDEPDLIAARSVRDPEKPVSL